ncbi:MAG: hypothetical protein ACD_62C00460G0009 [uncultured bacterium]|nr:MAG: hypothetical protein ACD_62C00460G0009 [uncultured bacterium]
MSQITSVCIDAPGGPAEGVCLAPSSADNQCEDERIATINDEEAMVTSEDAMRTTHSLPSRIMSTLFSITPLGWLLSPSQAQAATIQVREKSGSRCYADYRESSQKPVISFIRVFYTTGQRVPGSYDVLYCASAEPLGNRACEELVDSAGLYVEREQREWNNISIRDGIWEVQATQISACVAETGLASFGVHTVPLEQVNPAIRQYSNVMREGGVVNMMFVADQSTREPQTEWEEFKEGMFLVSSGRILEEVAEPTLDNYRRESHRIIEEMMRNEREGDWPRAPREILPSSFGLKEVFPKAPG